MSTEPAITVKYQAYQLKHVNRCLLLIKIPVEMSTRVIFEVENGNLCDLTFTQSKASLASMSSMDSPTLTKRSNEESMRQASTASIRHNDIAGSVNDTDAVATIMAVVSGWMGLCE